MRYIGVDLHKTNFVVCFLNQDESFRLETFPLSKAGISRFTSELSKDDAVAVEVTQNIYYFYDQIKTYVGRIVLVDTYRFAIIAASKKKTDKADALALTRFLKLDHLPQVPVPSEKVRQLRHLLKARETLVGRENQVQESGTRRADSRTGLRWRVRHLLPVLPENGCESAMTYQRQTKLFSNRHCGRLPNSTRKSSSWKLRLCAWVKRWRESNGCFNCTG